MTDARPHIEVRRDGPSGFAVAVSSPSADLDALFPPSLFPDHGRALYAARSMASAAGWRIVDRTMPIGAAA